MLKKKSRSLKAIQDIYIGWNVNLFSIESSEIAIGKIIQENCTCATISMYLYIFQIITHKPIPKTHVTIIFSTELWITINLRSEFVSVFLLNLKIMLHTGLELFSFLGWYEGVFFFI